MLTTPSLRHNAVVIQQGVVWSPYELNLHFSFWRWPTDEQEDPDLEHYYPGHTLHGSGVADDHLQIVKHLELLVDDPSRHYLIGLTKITKANQEPFGGWRWHKWGEYIGVQKPTCEYLYDEPVIEEVVFYETIQLDTPHPESVET